MEGNSNHTVLVTGASGYIGSHCVHQLLQAGYRVRGAVRNPYDTDRIGFLYDLASEMNANLKLVNANLLDRESWTNAIRGCTYILHVASPVSISVKNPDDMIKPAVEGTLNVLKTAVELGIKRVVVTSSIATMWVGNEDQIIDENDWSKEPDCSDYEAVKLQTERAVWEFYRKYSKKIDIVTINPGFVVGPVFNFGGGASEEIMQKLMTNQIPGSPDISLGIVDVRDVAYAHIRAMEVPEAAGQRYLLVNKSIWFKDMADYLRTEFEQYGYEIPSRKLYKFVLTLAGFFDPTLKGLLKYMDIEVKFDNSKSVKELGIEYTDPKRSIVDMAWSLINVKVIPNKTSAKVK